MYSLAQILVEMFFKNTPLANLSYFHLPSWYLGNVVKHGLSQMIYSICCFQEHGLTFTSQVLLSLQWVAD